jgi:cold shock protein
LLIAHDKHKQPRLRRISLASLSRNRILVIRSVLPCRLNRLGLLRFGLSPKIWLVARRTALARNMPSVSQSVIAIGSAIGLQELRPCLHRHLEWIRRQTMQKGTVKWFNSTKGYGFIKPSTGDKDVFVHISAVERAGLRSLNEGQNVEYELVTNRGRTSAENLKVA